MKRQQLGVSLSGLLVWCIILALVAVTGMKVVPSVIEYYKIVKATKAVAAQAPPGTSVTDLRKAFDRYANIDVIEAIKGSDLEISKDGNQVVIDFAYEKQIPLFTNVSLLINFTGSTAGGKGE